MANKTDLEDDVYAGEMELNDGYALAYAMSDMTQTVTTPVRQFATCLLSGFFVVGILLIIPALMQTAAAYVWAAQVRKEASTRMNAQESDQRGLQKSTHSAKHVYINDGHRLSKQDRTLFLYRLLACCASLLVLIFSTLPQLIIGVARPLSPNTIDKLWGWCHVLTYTDASTRCFATYLIVVPFGLLFWNFIFGEILPRPQLLTDNVFAVILRASVPIALFSFIIPVPMVAKRFVQYYDEGMTKCNGSPDGLVFMIYYDYLVTRVIPVACIMVFSIGFVLWLPRKDYGVFYEPGIFTIFSVPIILCETVIHVYHRIGLVDKLIEPNFSNFMLIAYALYHMSFSSTFVLATLRSVVSEIREEMRKRQMFFLNDSTEQEVEEMHGTKRQTDMIHGLQKQFSVAFRWKPDFTEEESRTFSISPMERLSTAASSTEPTETGVRQMSTTEAGNGKQTQVDDAILHYAILQRSAHLKQQSKRK
ncbi:hypothetical protein FGIG_02586 [Fasciola gigantica]|uniref:Uncharacterized protein n=1 Tax=Fasciola gigantica TaxID=46835 RepID=A0A504YWG9_FASGI|nr:hypothetical protein FGIG_02586 [Fasciola gigantica]